MPVIDPELKRALAMFSRFFDLIHQPLAVINHEGKYVYYNQESADLDGYTISQALGHHMLDVYPQMKETQSTMLTSLRKGVEYIGHYQIYTNAKGQAVDYQHTTTPLYGCNGNVIGAIEVGRNLSGVRRLQEQVVGLNKQLYAGEHEPDHIIITQNPGMLALIEKGKRLAASDVPVMIVGETGTGKELFSRLVHRYSRRAEKPFIALNCAALPATLIESTLFGTMKGAFTGAENNQGYLELADGGTLFLDELNSMPPEMQSKLLRFLQDKTFWKLGGNREIRSDVRIIAAMNASPARLIEEGKLRSDLFYRLGIGMLQVPTLAERPDDVLLLSRYFIDKYRDEMPHDIQGLGERGAQMLLNHVWPGNVRMLENTLVRSMIMQERDGPLEQIIFEDESPELTPTEPSPPVPLTHFVSVTLSDSTNLISQVENYEKQLIREAINRAGGRVAEAARRLGISRTTLHYKVKKYDIRLGVV
ncbi:TPA: sigma 54-interacting transcriptional regulator [Klebsiella oxytoca]|nr:sigma 54-interacting transcriptional regulator [Klebsiella oxytoca]HCJ7378749.1 sigma 54-interacting transcriptional regulator [Klebsiella oxytoca]HDX4249455.1 sigma 54-interacting transcriptional regulator [Klebsiella oxytoca]